MAWSVARLRGLTVELDSASVIYEDLRSHATRVEGERDDALEAVAATRAELEARRDLEAFEEACRAEESLFPGPFQRQVTPDVAAAPKTARLLSLPLRAGKLAWWAITLQLRSRLRERRVAKRIRTSGLFDDEYYHAMAPELPSALGDPVAHYVRHGAAEGRAPSAAFDTWFYLDTNPDVRSLGSNPLDHFAQHGWQEGRRPHPFFDCDFYLRTYPDVAESGENPLLHWLRDGWREGRRPFRSRVPAPTDQVLSGAGPIAKPEMSPGAPAGMRAGRAIFAARIPGSESARATPVETKSEPPLHPTADPRRAPESTFSVGTMNVAVERSAHEDDPVVLVVSHELPHPPRAGNQYRISRYVRWLRDRGNQVVMVYCPLAGARASEAEIEEAALELENLVVCDRDGRIKAAVGRRWERVLHELDGVRIEPLERGLVRIAGEDDDQYRERVSLEQTYCPDALARLVQYLDASIDGPAVVVPVYVWMTRLLPILRPETLSVVDAQDVYSSKQEKVLAFGVPNEVPLSPQQERALLERGDVTMAIQAEEARVLEKLVPDRPVITVGVDFDPVADLPERKEQGEPVMGIVGSGNAMNVKGTNDFLRFAWPMIRRDHPGTKLRVVGKVCNSLPPEVEGVELLGVVPSLDEFYASCDLVLNPTAAGTGLKIKTVEALVHGRRIVAWPLGVEGVPESLRRFCHVAKDWYEFSRHVSVVLGTESGVAGSTRGVALLSDEERRFVQDRLAASAVYAELGDLIDRHVRRESTDGPSKRMGAGREGATGNA